MNRKKVIFLSVLAGVILLISLVAGIWQLYFWYVTADHRYLQESWNIEIPTSAKEVYHQDNRGWFGDGDWYSAFAYDGEGDLPNGLYLTQDIQLDFDLKATMDQLQVPAEYRFDLLDGCLCRHLTNSLGHELTLVYDPETDLLYVIIYTW